MTQKWIGALVAVVVASSVGCKKDLHTSSVASVLPSGVASKLSPELLAFIEVIPADVSGFGYVELGTSLDKALPLSPEYKGMVDDYLEMAQRRWGIDARNLRGAGVAVQDQAPVWFFDLGNANLASLNQAEVSVVRVGKLTAVGTPAAVSAMVASGQRGEMLVKKRTAWVQHALGYAAGGAGFFTLAGEKLLAVADAQERKAVESVDDVTGVIASGGFTLHATAKPGKVADVRTPVEAGIAMGRVALAAKLAELSKGGPDAVLAILARHYGEAFLNGLQVTAQGDHLSLTMPWRAPQWPQTSPAPPLAERVVAPDEWAVGQVDLGAPILQTMIALTDLVGAKLDRGKLASELLAQGGGAGDFPGVDPRTFTISVGGMQALLSMHHAKVPVPKGVFPIVGGMAVAAETQWGLVIAPADMKATLDEALARKLAPMPLSTSSKVVAGGSDTRARIVVDLDRLPAMMKMAAGQLPVRTLELAATAHSFVATVVAKPGQAQQVVALIDMFKGAMMAEAEPKYRDRKALSVEEEVAAIAAYHQLLLLSQLATPKVEGDRLTFSHEFPMPDFTVVPWIGAVGVLGMSMIPKSLHEEQERQGGAAAAIAN